MDASTKHRLLTEGGRSVADCNDVSLVARLAQGDASASRLVWQRFAPMVRGRLRRAFGAEREIEDLAQDVFLVLFLFLVLFRRAHTLREPHALRAFVLSITAHVIHYEVRRKMTARRLSSFAEPFVPRATDADLDAREALWRLYRILDRLSIRDRTAFALRFLEGLEVAKVSQALNVSLPTIKRRLARAWTRVVIHARRDDALMTYIAYSRYGAAS